MSSTHTMLDRYLDDLLQGDERATFERAMERDSALVGHVAIQRRIDATLARRFTPPNLADLGSRIASAAIAAAPVSVRRARPALRILAAAALIAITFVAAFQAWVQLRPRPMFDPYAPRPWRSIAQVYDETVASGFNPAWVCRNDREFARAFRSHLGQSLAIFPPPPGIAWAGVDHTNTITPSTMTVLAYVNGGKVIVFADRKARDKATTLSAGSGLSLFRGEVSDLVLYECTPHPRPFLLDLFYAPDLVGPPAQADPG